jgi:hypothetical protein
LTSFSLLTLSIYCCIKIKYHPTKEGLFAYGTDIGTVGWFDEFQGDKNFKSFSSYHKNKVYSIQWCMPEWLNWSSGRDNMLVLSCGGDGQILLSDIARPKAPSFFVNDMIKEVNADWIQVLKVNLNSHCFCFIMSVTLYICIFAE